ncbi:MAG: redox-regulated ATPase YchF [Candidatus Woesearchaeota archaeon]|jgi:ribosome-binding ATPase YchF (GTP1/OBG family)|nr:redox-regulated ATPase YchF [Candidatus Woesearchaeota archaeon]MDP7322580.1 redox-regulated ATPase YchF [Candidatus Woesearchaeota archaeon]MDP7476375.1 redox-regulated ATPase YchF [Candidatus Woesearchaeota archaeon]|tara:strand:+ start:969 stop:2162 length:1194 start_codon:yes stop_codon:yes gene_type:complete
MLIGCVGKANVGKSTFFKAATLAEVEIANYPFTTIKPNHGTGFVKVDCVDREFKVKCNPRFGYCLNGKRFVPVELMDVAGLVPDAHKGVGLGNQFLDDLNQADILIHIIDVSGSTNEKGESVQALSYDPANDIKFLEHELDMWYLRLIEKGWEKFARAVNQEKPELHKAVAKQLSSLRVSEELMNEVIKRLGLGSDITNWDKNTLLKIAIELRKETKPMIIACNKIDVPGAEKNFDKLKKEFNDYILVPCSAESELALREAAKHGLIDYIPGENDFKIKNEQLNEKQKNALDFIKNSIFKKYETTGVQEVIDKAVFDLLKYIAIFPGGINKLQDQHGNVLPDCFLMPENSTALDFAFKLHTDIGNNFVKAIDVRNKKPVGKDYLLKNRDVIEIATSK